MDRVDGPDGGDEGAWDGSQAVAGDRGAGAGRAVSSSEADWYADLTPADRTDAVVQLTGVVAAVQAELATLVVACDAARDWEADGATDMAAWLAGHCALSQTSARRTVRVAKALVHLPCLHAALAEGAMSWEQICAAVRFATAETDAHLARILPGYSVEQIEALARQHRPRNDGDANDAHRRRRFGWRPDHEAGGFRYGGFLPTDQAVTVNAVLAAMAQAAGPVPETGVWDPFESRCADALHALADAAAIDDTETSPARRDRPDTAASPEDPDDAVGPAGSDADAPSSAESAATPPDRMRDLLARGIGCHVAIHVDEDVLSGVVPGNGTLDGMTIGVSTVRRLLCDAQRSTTVEDASGRAIGISRNAHDPPRWLRRQVVHRDGCCRFPGCSRQIRHLHHIAWWTRDHGPTDAANLAGLCWAHHRLVHEGGWTTTGNADGTLTFTSPAGRTLTSHRRPTRRTTRAAVTERLGVDLPPRHRGGSPPTPSDGPDGDGPPRRST